MPPAKKKRIKLIGLDIASKKTGWYINNKACGLIEVPSTLSLPQRLHSFRTQLLSILKRHKPTHVVIEDTYLRFQNVMTLKQLARFSGVALQLCAELDLEVLLLSATKIRKHCCKLAGRKVSKKNVYQFIVSELDLDLACRRLFDRDCEYEKDNDLTDAAAAVLAGKALLSELRLFTDA